MLEYLIHLFCEHKGMIQSSIWCLMIHSRTLEDPLFTVPNCDAAFGRCPPNRSRPSKLSIEIWNNQLARLTHGGKSQASSYDVLGPHANGPSTQHAEIKSMFVLIGSWRFPCASLGWGLHYLRFILCGDDVLIDQRPRLHEVLSTCVWLTAGHVFQTPHTMTEVIAVISHNWSSKFLPESKINSDSLQFIVYIIPKFQTVKSLNQSPVQSFLTIQTQSFNATNLDMLKPFSTVLIVPKLK